MPPCLFVPRARLAVHAGVYLIPVTWSTVHLQCRCVIVDGSLSYTASIQFRIVEFSCEQDLRGLFVFLVSRVESSRVKSSRGELRRIHLLSLLIHSFNQSPILVSTIVDSSSSSIHFEQYLELFRIYSTVQLRRLERSLMQTTENFGPPG